MGSSGEPSHLFLDDHSTNHKIRWNQIFPKQLQPLSAVVCGLSQFRASDNLWLDQLDILGGQRWDRAVEEALQTCQGMIAVLSPETLASHNVMDEVSYALEERKMIIPIFLRSCTIPFRLRRVQYIDFTADYQTGFSQLLRALRIDQPSQQRVPAAPEDTIVQGVTAPSKETPMEVSTLEQLQIRAEPPELGFAASAKRIWKQVLIVSVGWAIIGGIGMNIDEKAIAFLVIIGAIGGFTTGQALRTIEPSFQQKQVLIVSVGWAIGWAIGLATLWVTKPLLEHSFINGVFMVCIVFGIFGAIGGGTTFWQLISVRSKA